MTKALTCGYSDSKFLDGNKQEKQSQKSNNRLTENISSVYDRKRANIPNT